MKNPYFLAQSSDSFPDVKGDDKYKMSEISTNLFPKKGFVLFVMRPGANIKL